MGSAFHRAGRDHRERKTKFAVYRDNKNQFFYTFSYSAVSVLKPKEKLCGSVRDNYFVMNDYPF
jgi:hypothetical protein